jgi:hypothetical protein
MDKGVSGMEAIVLRKARSTGRLLIKKTLLKRGSERWEGD